MGQRELSKREQKRPQGMPQPPSVERVSCPPPCSATPIEPEAATRADSTVQRLTGVTHEANTQSLREIQLIDPHQPPIQLHLAGQRPAYLTVTESPSTIAAPLASLPSQGSTAARSLPNQLPSHHHLQGHPARPQSPSTRAHRPPALYLPTSSLHRSSRPLSSGAMPHFVSSLRDHQYPQHQYYHYHHHPSAYDREDIHGLASPGHMSPFSPTFPAGSSPHMSNLAPADMRASSFQIPYQILEEKPTVTIPRKSYHQIVDSASDILKNLEAFDPADTAQLDQLVESASAMLTTLTSIQQMEAGNERDPKRAMSSAKKKVRSMQGPLRCHSCKCIMYCIILVLIFVHALQLSTETPEWRKGPNGPRTLCNACGLIYAKMTKSKVKAKPPPVRVPPATMDFSKSNPGVLTVSPASLFKEEQLGTPMTSPLSASTMSQSSETALVSSPSTVAPNAESQTKVTPQADPEPSPLASSNSATKSSISFLLS
ncbi:hypothetical protein H4R35_005339 [Dimargaris xerosporica]|nr:hypothetical protein H4R35_005339 [Dimargaris xerosporica]